MLRKIKLGTRIAILGLALACALPVFAVSDSDEYLAEARKYLAKGKAREAIIELKNALKSDPANEQARVLLGTLYLGSGDAAGAQKEFERARRLGAPKQAWMVGLGQALIMQKDYDGILEQIQPDESMVAEQHATALAIRGNAYVASGDRESAVGAYDQALVVQKSNPLARLGKARLLLAENKVSEAVEQFTEVLADYPDHVETRLARGELYRVEKKLKESIEDFSVAIEKAPHEVRGYVGRALANIALGAGSEAKADIAELSRRAKDLPVTHYLAALVAFQEADHEKAGEELQYVLRAAPDNFQAQLLYGIVSYARGQYTVADDYLARVTARGEKNIQLLKLLGAARIKLQNYQGAIEALEPLLKEETGRDAQTLALLGTAYMLAGNSAKGTEYMNQAVELAPDRAFLRTIANRIAEIDRGRLFDFTCDYDTFLRRKQELLHAEAQEQARFDKKLAEEEVWIRKGIKARRTRNEGRVRALKKMRQERASRREQQGQAKLRITDEARSGKRIIEAKDIGFAYADRTIVRNFSTVIQRGDRIGIIGPNGAGKTTLIKLLLGQLTPDSGELKLGTNIEVAYFDQLRAQLDPEKTIVEFIGEGREQITIGGRSRHVISYLGDFLFTPARARSQIKSLSGGERARVLLALLFSKPVNFLVLDEPTNDLDIETLELLEEVLLDFQGTLLLVSHDRAFMDNVITSTLVLDGEGAVEEYLGGYTESMEQARTVAELKADSGKEQAKPKVTPVPAAPVKTAARKKLSYHEQRELDALPGQIEDLEARQEELNTTLSAPGLYQDSPQKARELNDRLHKASAELDRLMERWAELEE